MGARKNWTASCKRVNLKNSLRSYTKIHSKCNKDLNVTSDTIKLLGKNVGRTLFDIHCSNIFLDLSSRVMETKTKINK